MNHEAVYFLKKNDQLYFPPANKSGRNGLVAVGGDLSAARLLLAYRSGIFPWYDQNSPIIWWSPDPRCVLFPDDFHISKSFRKFLKKNKYQLTVDSNFLDVVKACALSTRKDQTGTWIVPEMIAAYHNLYLQGYAHSFEALDDKSNLVGGIYGISLGRIFFGESMFTLKNNASKFVMHALVNFCRQHNFTLIDCQIANNHLLSLGATQISRQEFLNTLSDSLKSDTLKGSWQNFNPTIAGG